ncbi:MAG: hypothetical protein MRY64_13155 [Hyphomonadaceae bacterium]|nr:hypothetical protein [Hyphomonadaceae bacterium]
MKLHTIWRAGAMPSDPICVADEAGTGASATREGRRKEALRNFCKPHGIAAVEFAFIAPLLVVMMLVLVELTLRYQGVEKFHRYSSQAGDLASRSVALTSSDIHAIHASAGKMMHQVSVGDGMTLTVTSIGFDSTGTPKILWQRTEPESEAHLPINLADAVALGYPGDTVIRTDTRFIFSSAISTAFGLEDIELKRKMYFRPRSSRVITMDGEVSENGEDWDAIPDS